MVATVFPPKKILNFFIISCTLLNTPQLILISWFLVKGKKLKHKNDTSPLFDIIIYLDLASGILQLVTQPV